MGGKRQVFSILLAVTAFTSFSVSAVQPSTEEEGLLWIAQELASIRDASHELQVRQVQGSSDVFEYEALQLDLTRMITEIKARVHKRQNPAYQYQPLEVEKGGY